MSGATLGAAASDSVLAYACAPASAATPSDATTWLTRDRGASWDSTATITVSIGSPVEVTDCQIVVDATEAGTAVAQVGFNPNPQGGCPGCREDALYLTTDMGQHWASLTLPSVSDVSGRQYPLTQVRQLSTYQQTTYGLFAAPLIDMSVTPEVLLESRDHLRTWTLVSGLSTGLPSPVGISEFQLNPVTGALLVRLLNSSGFAQEDIRTSTDGGVTWSRLGTPPILLIFDDIVVQQPFTDQPWRICGGNPLNQTGNAAGPTGPNPYEDTLACTSDDGARWTLNQLDVPNDCCGGGNSGANYGLVGIADDGSVLLITPSGLERVVPGVSGMQSLGSTPNGGLMTYVVGNGAGALWSAPQQNYTDPDPQGRIFTALYT